jgi:hypothetical protein
MLMWQTKCYKDHTAPLLDYRVYTWMWNDTLLLLITGTAYSNIFQCGHTRKNSRHVLPVFLDRVDLLHHFSQVLGVGRLSPKLLETTISTNTCSYWSLSSKDRACLDPPTLFLNTWRGWKSIFRSPNLPGSCYIRNWGQVPGTIGTLLTVPRA